MPQQNAKVSVDASVAALKSLGRASIALSELAGAYIHRQSEREDRCAAGAYATVSNEPLALLNCSSAR